MGAADKWIAEANCDTPTGEVAGRALAARLGRVLHTLPLAAHLAYEDIEHVHAARVATRRAGAALRMYADFMPERPRKRMRKMLKGIRDSMGEARDLDVYLERLANDTDQASRELIARLERQRRLRQSDIIRAAMPLLLEEKLRNRVGKLIRKSEKHAVRKLRQRPFGEWATERLAHEWQAMVAGVPGDNPGAAELHEFRIVTKQFRYALELLGGGLPSKLRKSLYPQVKRLQARLGEIQDHAVAAEKLAAWQSGAGSKRERRLLEKLEGEERKRYEGKTVAFAHWWRHDRIDELAATLKSPTSPPEDGC